MFEFIDNELEELEKLRITYARNNISDRLAIVKEKIWVHEKYKTFICDIMHHAQCRMIAKNLGDVSFKH